MNHKVWYVFHIKNVDFTLDFYLYHLNYFNNIEEINDKRVLH
jgi:hypothetical protein